MWSGGGVPIPSAAGDGPQFVPIWFRNTLEKLEDALLEFIVGNAEPTEKRPNLAAERAVNSKAYLTSGEAQLGIDPSRIETRTGNAGARTADRSRICTVSV